MRASFYRYELLSAPERRQLGAYWRRTYLGEYYPPRSRELLTESAA